MKNLIIVLTLILLLTSIVLPQKKSAVKKPAAAKKVVVAPEMIFVKGGTFEMGSNNGKQPKQFQRSEPPCGECKLE